MASSNHEIKGALAEGVKFNHAQAIQKIHTDENGRVSGVTLKKCLSMFDENGRFAPTYDEEDTRELKVDTIVFAIGQGVEAEFAREVLEQRPNGWTKVDYEGKEGYIKTEFLQLAESAAGAESIGTVTATTNINVRASASETADRLGVLSGGDSAELVGTEGDWSKIKYNGQIGYVKSEYVQ